MGVTLSDGQSCDEDQPDQPVKAPQMTRAVGNKFSVFLRRSWVLDGVL
jgi:hypothetical protein